MKEKFWDDWDSKLYKEPEKPPKKEKPKEAKEDEAANGGKQDGGDGEGEEKKKEEEDKGDKAEEKKEDEEKKEWGRSQPEKAGGVVEYLKPKSWWYCDYFVNWDWMFSHVQPTPRASFMYSDPHYLNSRVRARSKSQITKDADQNTLKIIIDSEIDSLVDFDCWNF